VDNGNSTKKHSTVYDCEEKKLTYHRVTAQHSQSVEILSTAAQLYEKSHLKRLAIDA